MMVFNQSGIRKRFTPLTPAHATRAPAHATRAPAPATRELPKEHPAAFRSAFEAASDEKQFFSDLEYVLVSIAALMCCTPLRAAMSDERVQRILLSLQGLSTPYLQSRFKSEAQQVANRQNFAAEQQVRQRPSRSRFPSPAIKVSAFLRGDTVREIDSRFFTEKQEQEKKFFEMQRQARLDWQTECIVTRALQAKLVLPAPRPGM